MAAGGAVLEETTATAGDILKGKTANDGEGEQIIGTLELTGDADAGEVLSGKTFYTTNPKSKQTGTMVNNGRWPDAEKLTLEGSKIWMYKTSGYTEGGLGIAASNLGNASSGHVLSGVSASSSNGLKFSGTMTNRGAWGSTLNPGGSVTVPQGYHSGSGKVSAKAVHRKDITAQASAEGYSSEWLDATVSANVGGLGTIIGVTASLTETDIYNQNISTSRNNTDVVIVGSVVRNGNTASVKVSWQCGYYEGHYWKGTAKVTFTVFYY